jgi:co-chaperonin GroES (HSP10)
LIKPIGHKILVKADDIETTTDSGIVLVLDEKLERASQMRGTLVAIGPTAWQAFRYVDTNGKWKNGKPWALPGDRVLYSKYAGKIVEDPETEQDFVLMNDEDLVAVITGEQKVS